MPVDVNTKIRKLSASQRKKVEARAEKLIAEEMTLRDRRAVVIAGIADPEPAPTRRRT